MAELGISKEIVQIVLDNVSGYDIEVEKEELIEELFALLRTKLELIENPRHIRGFWDPFEECRREAVALFTTKKEDNGDL